MGDGVFPDATCVGTWVEGAEIPISRGRRLISPSQTAAKAARITQNWLRMR